MQVWVEVSGNRTVKIFWKEKKILLSLFFSPLKIPMLGVFYNHTEKVSMPSCNTFWKISPHLSILIIRYISSWNLKANLKFAHLVQNISHICESHLSLIIAKDECRNLFSLKSNSPCYRFQISVNFPERTKTLRSCWSDRLLTYRWFWLQWTMVTKQEIQIGLL